MSKLPCSYQRFQDEVPLLWKTFESLSATASQAGPLEVKVRELVKLCMAAANQSKSAVKPHTHRALEAGATADEIQHAELLGRFSSYHGCFVLD
jgi:AhpD family alkylhydroperoxidase